jgi:ABC-type branched-subunit amino acid transport system substrate-binding protein
MSYDAMMILGLAMRKAGADVNKAKVRDAMAATIGHRGVTGVIDIDEYGDANREILIIGIDNKGAYEVVWPKR